MDNYMLEKYGITFKDERLNYALNLASLSSIGENIIRNIFKDIPMEIIESINNGESVVVKNGGKFYSCDFIFDDHYFALNSISLQVKDDVSSILLDINTENFREKTSGVALLSFIENRKTSNSNSKDKQTTITFEKTDKLGVIKVHNGSFLPYKKFISLEDVESFQSKLKTRNEYIVKDFKLLREKHQEKFSMIKDNINGIIDFLDRDIKKEADFLSKCKNSIQDTTPNYLIK